MLGLDFLQSVINVNWGAPKHFLITGRISIFTGKMQSSLDGDTWKDVPLSAGQIFAAAYGDGYWIVMGNPIGAVVNVVQFWKSADFKDWSMVHSSTGSVPARGSGAWGRPTDAEKDEEGNAPEFGVFVFVTDVGVRYTSKDVGETWTREDLAPNEQDSLLGNVTFINGAFFIGVKGKQFLTGSNDAIGNPNAFILRSTTGKSWNKSAALFSDYPFINVPNTNNMVIPNGALYVMYLKKAETEEQPAVEKYVVVGWTNIDVSAAEPDVSDRRVLAIATSADGKTWSSGTFITAHGPLNGGIGCAGKDGFVVPVVTYQSATTQFAPSASIGRSTDSLSWTFTTPSGGSGSLGNNVNLVGGIAFSPNAKPPGETPEETAEKAPGMFVAAGKSGNDGYLLSSPDGKSWTAISNDFIGGAEIMCVATGKIPKPATEE